MTIQMTMSDFIEVCKFNEAINREMEEDRYDDIDEDEDDDAWWNDLRQTESIKEAIEQRHERENRQNEYYI